MATYWPNVLEWCNPDELEYELTTFALPLPSDQRHGKKDMDKIVSMIRIV